MRTGQESRTAVMVCAARAAAQGRTLIKQFDDPTAMTLLPEAARRRVERQRSGTADGNTIRHAMQATRMEMAAVRTVAIDEAIEAAGNRQLVILGAGLDGRAWRMRALAETVVFEVDHPESQARKRERAAGLSPVAGDIRFVPVDFTRDSLDQALADAGHDPAVPTTWVWEGVVMYLTRPHIEATLSTVATRSAPRSRLLILYHSPAAILRLVGFLVGFVGEPLRSAFTADEMRALLASHGYEPLADRTLPEIAAHYSDAVASATRALRHMRLVTAERISAVPETFPSQVERPR